MPVGLVARRLGDWMSGLVERSLPLSLLDARQVAAFTQSQADVGLGAHVGAGTICVWDLAERRLLGQPLQGHSSEVFGLRVADLDSRP
ncbi:hypothetical protein ACIBO5_57755 [Nonomuraea angiospora]|uniref:hypothetical protein n=1 Tax=Nonomuraea angiospora TaxID=46172 RepID=UPI003790D3DF